MLLIDHGDAVDAAFTEALLLLALAPLPTLTLRPTFALAALDDGLALLLVEYVIVVFPNSLGRATAAED